MGWISGLSLGLVLLLCVLVVGAGVAVRYGVIFYQKQQGATRGWYQSDKQLTWVEIVIVSMVTLFAVLPLTNMAVHHLAQSNAVGGYKEFWNGSLTVAYIEETVCYKNGPCVHEYDCDPYPVYITVYTYDSKGNVNGSYQQFSHYEYEKCPFATAEYTYLLDDSIGQTIAVASHIFAENPREWRGGSGIPSDVPRGDPQYWLDMKAAIERGDSPPSTKVAEYVNYLLAASDSLLRSYSGEIEMYREKGLIPDHTRNMKSKPIYNGHLADKAMFVKMDPGADKYRAWQEALNRLNAQLGTERQGDLHVLAVPASEIDNPDSYTNALLADWQSRQYGKEALAKNAIMLVVGVSSDGKTVEWSRAKTGIPEGNGEMLAALSLQLEDTKFTPQDLLGGPKATWSGEGEGSLSFTSTDGTVEQIVLRDYPFLRPCMMCDDEDDVGQGYVYLKDSALLPGWAPWAFGISVFVIACVLFGAMVYVNLDDFVRSLSAAVSDLAGKAGRKIRHVIDNLPGRGL